MVVHHLEQAALHRPVGDRRGLDLPPGAAAGARENGVDAVLVRVAGDVGDHVRVAVEQLDERLRGVARRTRLGSPRWIGCESRGSRSQPGLRVVLGRVAVAVVAPVQGGGLVGHLRVEAADRVVAEQHDQLVARGRSVELVHQPLELRVVDVAVADRSDSLDVRPPSETVSSSMKRKPGACGGSHA